MSFNDDDVDLHELSRMSVDEILNEGKVQETFSGYVPTKEDELETTRDFIAVSERLINHRLTQEEAEKIAIRQMREYYTDSSVPIEAEIDTWLKFQENKYKIGSCYDDDYDSHPEDETQDYDENNLSDRAAFEDQYEKEYWEFVDDYEDSEREKRLQKDLGIDEGSCYEPNETREDTDYHYAEHFNQRFGNNL